MLPYFVMIGVPAALSLLLPRLKYDSKTANRIVIDSFFLIWLILLILRHESVGVDLVRYRYHFANYPELSWLEIFKGIFLGEFEAGYILIVKTASYFTDNFHWVKSICALISVVPLWRLFRDKGANGFLSIVLFLNIAPFSMYFSGLRQAMAMAFAVPCYYCCKDKKLLKFLLFVFLAFLFHRSALILLLMYPVFNLRLKKQLHILYLLPLLITVYIFRIPIFSFLMIFMGDDFSDYATGIHDTGAYSIFLLLILLLIYSFLIPEKDKLDYATVGVRNILVLSVCLQAFAGAHSIAMRMNYYYLPFVAILIPSIVKAGNQRYTTLIKLSLVSMYAFFTVYYIYKAHTSPDILQVYPYVAFWVNDMVLQ